MAIKRIVPDVVRFVPTRPVNLPLLSVACESE